MKNLIAAFVLFLQTSFSLGQLNSFAPVGSKWYYNYESFFCQSGYCSYISVESTKDTMVSSVLARKLEITKVSPFDTSYLGFEIMHGDSNSIYHFNGQAFYKIYDFNVVTGDTLILNNNVFTSQSELGEDGVSFQVVIDSVGELQIGINLFKVVYSHNTGTMGYGGPIVQYIGDMGFFLGAISPSLGLNQFLRCYQDSNFVYNAFALPCNYIQIGTGIQNLNSTNSIESFPNPCFKEIHLKVITSEPPPYTISLFNSLGVLQNTYLSNSTAIDISCEHLYSGIFSYYIMSRNISLVAKGNFIVNDF